MLTSSPSFLSLVSPYLASTLRERHLHPSTLIQLKRQGALRAVWDSSCASSMQKSLWSTCPEVRGNDGRTISSCAARKCYKEITKRRKCPRRVIVPKKTSCDILTIILLDFGTCLLGSCTFHNSVPRMNAASRLSHCLWRFCWQGNAIFLFPPCGAYCHQKKTAYFIYISQQNNIMAYHNANKGGMKGPLALYIRSN